MPTNQMIVYYRYTVTINSYRQPSESSLTSKFLIDLSKVIPLNSKTVTMTYSNYQNHTPPLSGTFKLTIDNK